MSDGRQHPLKQSNGPAIGVFTIDDDLYDSLTNSQLDRLRALIGN